MTDTKAAAKTTQQNPAKKEAILAEMKQFHIKHKDDPGNVNAAVRACLAVVHRVDKADAYPLLYAMERIRQEREHDPGCTDWAVRVCQAIVAKAHGYTSRTQWSTPIFEAVQQERKAKQ